MDTAGAASYAMYGRFMTYHSCGPVCVDIVLLCVSTTSFRDNELKSLLEMRGVTGAEMSWVRDGVEGDDVRLYLCSYIVLHYM